MKSILIEFHPWSKPRREVDKQFTAYVCGPLTVFLCGYSIALKLAATFGLDTPDERQTKLL